VPQPRVFRRWLIPHFGVLFFMLHVVRVLARPGDMLKDPGVGWHLRAGHLMLEARTLLRTDPFSFTAEGRPWIDYYWGFQIASAAIERLGGLPLVATAWMLVYACIPFVLYRNAVRGGASPLAVLLVLPIAHTVLLSHALARPHVVTYLFFAILVGRLDDVETGRRGWRTLWWLPLLAMVWANTHGGFVAGLAAVGAVTLASALGPLVVRGSFDWRRSRVFAALLVAMVLATLVNPYGPDLHAQAIHHVSVPSTGRFAEFRSPDFRSGGASIGCFEVLLLATLLVTATGWLRPTWGSIALLVATLHMALTSVRNINLFVLVATPLVAAGLTRLLAERWPHMHARWAAIGADQDASASWRWHLAIVSGACLALAMAGRLPFPTTLDGLQLSRGAVGFIDAHAERFTRSFNTDGLGGTLIYRFWPRLRVFVDDRTPVYGEPFMQDYFRVFDARPGWQDVLDRWGVTGAIMATGTPIAPVLRASPQWSVDYEDAQTLVCSRRGPS
jgi:hypothetical protein